MDALNQAIIVWIVGSRKSEEQTAVISDAARRSPSLILNRAYTDKEFTSNIHIHITSYIVDRQTDT